MKRVGLLLLYPILFLGLIVTAIRYLICIITNTEKAIHIALMIDQTCNVDANGRVDETISARAAKAMNADKKWGCLLCKFLGMIQKNHCQKALADDLVK